MARGTSDVLSYLDSALLTRVDSVNTLTSVPSTSLADAFKSAFDSLESNDTTSDGSIGVIYVFTSGKVSERQVMLFKAFPVFLVLLFVFS